MPATPESVVDPGSTSSGTEETKQQSIDCFTLTASSMVCQRLMVDRFAVPSNSSASIRRFETRSQIFRLSLFMCFHKERWWLLTVE